MTKCSVNGCGKRSRSNGFCNPHYMRWNRNGDPTAGNTSRGESLRWLDEAIFSAGDDCFSWPYSKSDKRSRKPVKFLGKCVSVTRLVCEIANGPAPSRDMEAAHLCGMGHVTCINPKHLKWATKAQNYSHRKIHKQVKGPAAVPLVERMF